MFSNPLKMTLLSLTVLVSSGCSILPSIDWGDGVEVKPVEVEVKTVEVKVPIIHPQMPRAIKLKEPQWYVVSDKNLDTFLEDIKKKNGGGVVFIAMSVGDYELMAYNMQEIKRYINEMKEVVIYYRTINEDPKEETPPVDKKEKE
jgi:L-ascorbate metabolism protein UlaG (beta-lactamase superfamily)